MAQFLVKQNEIAPCGVIFNETKYKLNEKKNKKKYTKYPFYYDVLPSIPKHLVYF